ncbi:hypothetical protein [Larkinella knui]|nr:hypothetical protein [Larkinella knui]
MILNRFKPGSGQGAAARFETVSFYLMLYRTSYFQTTRAKRFPVLKQ